MTIRKKLVLWYAGLLAVIIVAFGFVTFSVIRWSWLSYIDLNLQDTADQIIADSLAVSVPEFGGGSGVTVRLAELNVFRASGIAVQVWQTWDEGQPIEPNFLGASDNLRNFERPLNPYALGSTEAVFHDLKVDGSALRVLTRPILLENGQYFGNVQIAAPLDPMYHNMNILLAVMIISCGAAMLGSIALGLTLANQALKPIEAITKAASNIANANDLSTRLPSNGPQDELGKLTSVFNHMLQRLEHLFQVQQRFVADVSHELRTPLTAMRGNLDLIKRYGSDPDSLDAIESELARMSRMVNDLLTLARADAGTLTFERYPLDLDTVITDVYRDAKLLAKAKHQKVNIQRFEPVRINGNPDRLRQLLLNLLTNAFKFTPQEGYITLNLYRHSADYAAIEVADTGIGIMPQDLEHIFDRFYQADSARVHLGGAGLGLSIAKWIAEAHEGKIEVSSEVGDGTTFTVLLPLLERDQMKLHHNAPTRPRLTIIRRRSEAPSEHTPN